MNMKKLSKVFALMLAVIMIAAMTTVAFAAPSSATGSVTVEKAVVGETVKFYRVLDYVDATGAYAATDSFKQFFTAKGYTTDDEILAYLAGIEDNTAAAQTLARDIGTFAADNSITAAAERVVDNATYTVEGLPYGYYLMAPSLPGNTDDAIIFSLGKLENANVTITNKLSVPTPEKTVTDSDETNKKSNIAAIGEKMTFTVTGKVPNMSEYTTYYFEIADTMTNMAYVADSMTLTIGGTVVDISTTDSTANVYGVASGNSINVKITDLKSITSAIYNAEIKLEYKARLTDSAVMGNTGNINEVKYIYSNNPASDGKGESPMSKTKTFTLGITVNKTDSDGDALKGSTWLLTKGNVTVAKIDGAALSKFDWKGLTVGTYTLTETAAPNNYTKMEGEITIEIKAEVSNQVDTDGTYTLTTYTAKVTGPQGYVTKTDQSGYANLQTGITSLNVKNFENGELPTTGGVGLYVILGLAGAAFAGMVVVIIIKKRMSAKEK